MALARYLLLLLVTPALLLGCDLVSEDEPDAPFRAQVAGELWKGETKIFAHAGSLSVQGVTGDVDRGIYDEVISLSIGTFSGEGEYQLEGAFYYKFIGGDVIDQYGYAETAPENVVTITRYDASAAIIQGEFRFEAVANRSFNRVEEGTPFEVVGRFEARLPGIAFQAAER